MLDNYCCLYIHQSINLIASYLLLLSFPTTGAASRISLAKGTRTLFKNKMFLNGCNLENSFQNDSPVLKSPGDSVKRLTGFVRDRVISKARSAKNRLKLRRQEVRIFTAPVLNTVHYCRNLLLFPLFPLFPLLLLLPATIRYSYHILVPSDG